MEICFGRDNIGHWAAQGTERPAAGTLHSFRWVIVP